MILGLTSCAGVTQLIVVVDTDYAVPAGLDALRVEVTGPSGETRTTEQALDRDSRLPMTVTVVPGGESLGPVEIRAVGLLDGAEVVDQRARVTLESGRSLTLRMFLSAMCGAVSCGATETCVCGACEGVDRPTSEWSGSPPEGPCELPMDAGPRLVDGGDAGPGLPDGGDAGDPGDAAMGCTSNADCDDRLDCTTDACVAGACTFTPDDARCTDGTGGMCVEGFGCQYDGCSPATCVAGPCQTARCDGDQCVLESACGASEECCGDACVPRGCDDGNPCTDDACGAAGCDNTPNAAVCDDGVFCNGPDTCSAGLCDRHAGDPCAGGSVCEEAMDRCVGCAADSDCPAPLAGPWGSCSYPDTCAESGTQSRTVTTYACVSNVCQPSSASEDRACSRATDGDTCGSTTFGTWGSCGSFADACDESGTRTRTRTDRVCASGVCSNANSPDSGACVRDTDGDGCGMTTYGAWGSCGGFSDTCDETGTRSRTQTDFTCVTGACTPSMSTDTGSCTRNQTGVSCAASTFTGWSSCGGFSGTCDESGTQSRTRTDFACTMGSCATTMVPESRACTRDQTGVMCAATTYGPWSSCSGFSSICDNTGTRSRTETTFACSGGSCTSRMGTDTGSCSRTTTGTNCDDFLTCRRGTCSSTGVCNYTDPVCSGTCCEPGFCLGGGMGGCP